MSDCTCKDCIAACKRHPGILAPQDVPRIAKYLKKTEEELKLNYIIEDYSLSESGAGETVYHYRPKKKGVDGSATLASLMSAYQPGRCVFLKKDRCSIHMVKPMECRISMPCKGIGESKEEVLELWKNNK